MGKIDAVLAEMRQERERLVAELARVERVIEALEQARAAGAPIVPARGVAQVSLPGGVGPYSLLDIYEATAHYLSTVDTPKSSSEIAAALRAGGFKTRSRKFVNTVRVMLRRKDGRTTGISVTKDGKRWFVKQKAANPRTKKPSQAEE